MENNENPIGVMIASRITYALVNEGLSYNYISDIVYKECSAIASELKKGDWIQMPDGSQFTMTFKPGDK